MLALSATAAPRVRADILRLLSLRSPLVQVSSARRDNLHYAMQRRPRDPMPHVLEALAESRGASLIYARTRRSVERWAEKLQQQDVDATSYHAGLDPETRHSALSRFLEQKRPVLVATAAFGMGVDRSDVGLVPHSTRRLRRRAICRIRSCRSRRLAGPLRGAVLAGDRTSLGWAMQASARKNASEEQRRWIWRNSSFTHGGRCRR